MKDLTKEQIEMVNEAFKSIGFEEEEIIEIYGVTSDKVSIEDKIEEITQFYSAAGFDIDKSELLEIFRGLEKMREKVEYLTFTAFKRA